MPGPAGNSMPRPYPGPHPLAVAAAGARRASSLWTADDVAKHFKQKRCVQFQVVDDEGEPRVFWSVVWRLTEQLREIELGGRVAGKKDTRETITQNAYQADTRLISMAFIDFITEAG